MSTCTMGDCTAEATGAIRTRAPLGKSLVTTIWQHAEDAPKVASRYCGRHMITTAAGLAQLSDPSETYALVTKEASR